MSADRMPEQIMADLGIVQAGSPLLARPVRPLDLPAETAVAIATIAALCAAADRVREHHPFTGGMGIAAPQLGVDRPVAVILADGDYLPLLNPRVIERSVEVTEQYEGCLSFFGVRGLVPRARRIVVAHTGLDGVEAKSEFVGGPARLVAHELDHLDGRLYTAHLRQPLISLAEYQRRAPGVAAIS